MRLELNMTHSMFENTYNGLKDCYDKLAESDIETLESEANEYEKPYIRKLIELCETISEDFID